MNNVSEYPWVGQKTEIVVIRLTPAEKAELVGAVQAGMFPGIGRYLMSLHRDAQKAMDP